MPKETEKPELPATVRREIERIEKRMEALRLRWRSAAEKLDARFKPQLDAYADMISRLSASKD